MSSSVLYILIVIGAPFDMVGMSSHWDLYKIFSTGQTTQAVPAPKNSFTWKSSLWHRLKIKKKLVLPYTLRFSTIYTCHLLTSFSSVHCIYSLICFKLRIANPLNTWYNVHIHTLFSFNPLIKSFIVYSRSDTLNSPYEARDTLFSIHFHFSPNKIYNIGVNESLW